MAAVTVRLNSFIDSEILATILASLEVFRLPYPQLSSVFSLLCLFHFVFVCYDDSACTLAQLSSVMVVVVMQTFCVEFLSSGE